MVVVVVLVVIVILIVSSVAQFLLAREKRSEKGETANARKPLSLVSRSETERQEKKRGV